MKRSGPIKRKTPLRRSSALQRCPDPISRRRGIRRISPKQRRRNDAYRQARLEYFEDLAERQGRDAAICEVLGCHAIATQIHHKRGRIGDRLTNKEEFLGCCAACHRRIENDPAWATEQGYRLPR